MMRTTFCKALLATLLIAAFLAFVALDGPHRMSVEALKAQRDVLVQFADVHRTAAIALAFSAYAGAVALSVPGGAFFSLACGLMFGRLVGTAVAVAAGSVGATLIFLTARYLFGGIARMRLPAAGQRLNAGFTRHAFRYLLVLRVVPLFPFVLVNLAPAFTSIRVSTYVGATVLGIIPATFVYANLGDALAYADSLQAALSVRTVGPAVLLVLLALVPVIGAATAAFRSRLPLRRSTSARR
jgi:uncharacterized membrane protein YdjX (TVP38/TMEM64 family)